ATAGRRDRRGDPRRAGRQPLPLHGLPEHRQRGPAGGTTNAINRHRGGLLKLVDLTHTFSIHTPGWVGYPSPKLSYFQRHATHGIVSQWLALPLHSATPLV